MDDDVAILEQALKNPKTNAPLNEWLSTQLDARFAEMDAKWEARHKKLEEKLDISSEFIQNLKDQNKHLLELLKKVLD